MCKCTPGIKTPFCGKPGCEWPKEEGVKQSSKSVGEITVGVKIEGYEEVVSNLETLGAYLDQLISKQELFEHMLKMQADNCKNLVIIDRDKFEHLLNCMCNQKFIHEQKPEVQKEWQDTIDKAWNEGMSLLSKG